MNVRRWVDLVLWLSLIQAAPAASAGVDSLFVSAIAGLGIVEPEESIGELLAVVAKQPENADAWHELAKLRMKTKTLKGRIKAEQALTKALRLDPGNIEYEITLGDLWWIQGMYHDAEAKYRQVLESDPVNVQVALRIGNRALKEYIKYSVMQNAWLPGGTTVFAEFAERDRKKAVQFLSRAIELDPDGREAYYKLGQLYYESGKPKGLIGIAEVLLRRFPDDSDGLLFCGLGYQADGDEGRAARMYALALDQMAPRERVMMESVDLITTGGELETIRISDPEPSAETASWTDGPDRKRFWRRQDPLFLTDFNERRMEHYGRVAYANLAYSAPGQEIEGWKQSPGKAYIKFGRPLRRIATFFTLNEIWFYEDFRLEFFGDGYGEWAFDVGIDPGDFWRSMRNAMSQPPFSNAYQSHAVRSAHLKKLRIQSQNLQPTTRELFVKKSPRYLDPYRGRKYPLSHQVATFRDADQVRVELAYAIPAQKLQLDDDGLMRLEDGLFVFNEKWDEVSREVEDRFELEPAGEDSLKLGYLLDERQILLDPGEYHFVVEALDPRTQTIGAFREHRTVSFPDTALGMSDLLLASRIDLIDPYPEFREDVEIVPNPLRLYRREEPVRLYFELYNLVKNEFGRTLYEIAYHVGRPTKDEIIDASYFPDYDEEGPSDEYRLVEVDRLSTVIDTTSAFDSFTGVERVVEYRVRYAEPKRKRPKEPTAHQVWETSVTARYEGDRREAVNALSIDVSEMPIGIHKLTVSVKDLVDGGTAERTTYFRLVD